MNERDILINAMQKECADAHNRIAELETENKRLVAQNQRMIDQAVKLWGVVVANELRDAALASEPHT